MGLGFKGLEFSGLGCKGFRELFTKCWNKDTPLLAIYT